MDDPVDLHVVIGPDDGRRLDKAIAAALPDEAGLSRSRIGELIKAGAVRMGGQVLQDPSAPVRGRAEVVVTVPPVQPSAAVPEAMALDIVYEDGALVVVNKPAGMVVHPGAGVASGTLVNGLLHHAAGSLSGIGGEARPGIVHRIDKDTSGLLVVAKTDAAHQALAAQFAAHSVHRRYRALVWGVPDAGDPRLAGLEAVSAEPGGVLRVNAPIGRHPKDRLRMAVVASGRRAVTRARVLRGFGVAADMEMWLETGRTHQIRVHMAHLGHPLVADPVYGRGRNVPQGLSEAVAAMPGQALHAAELGFWHPVLRQEMRFERPLPAAFAAVLSALEG